MTYFRESCKNCDPKQNKCSPGNFACQLKVPIAEQCIATRKVNNLAKALDRLKMRISVRKDGNWAVVKVG